MELIKKSLKQVALKQVIVFVLGLLIAGPLHAATKPAQAPQPLLSYLPLQTSLGTQAMQAALATPEAPADDAPWRTFAALFAKHPELVAKLQAPLAEVQQQFETIFSNPMTNRALEAARKQREDLSYNHKARRFHNWLAQQHARPWEPKNIASYPGLICKLAETYGLQTLVINYIPGVADFMAAHPGWLATMAARAAISMPINKVTSLVGGIGAMLGALPDSQTFFNVRDTYMEINKINKPLLTIFNVLLPAWRKATVAEKVPLRPLMLAMAKAIDENHTNKLRPQDINLTLIALSSVVGPIDIACALAKGKVMKKLVPCTLVSAPKNDAQSVSNLLCQLNSIAQLTCATGSYCVCPVYNQQTQTFDLGVGEMRRNDAAGTDDPLPRIIEQEQFAHYFGYVVNMTGTPKIPTGMSIIKTDRSKLATKTALYRQGVATQAVYVESARFFIA